VNSGSLEEDLIEKYRGVTPEGLVENALRWVEFCERLGFENLVVSMKSSSAATNFLANRMLTEKIDHPLHIGVTEAGPVGLGSVRSAAGIGALLALGIGDTIRVSLTGDPVEEVRVAYEILRSLEIRSHGPLLISCPTCSRTRVDLSKVVERVERALEGVTKDIRVAVMGCEVNGPGEAREADVGVAAARDGGHIFRRGVVVRTVKESEIVRALIEEIEAL
jgi:(E)-4-hydroxy-3-methylbut-2-enyl-diphosphate synthase